MIGLLAQYRPQPAIRLSRKDWLFRADRAVLCPVRGAGCASGSCPAGFFAEVGFGGGGDGRRTTEGDPDAQDKVEAQTRITRKR